MSDKSGFYKRLVHFMAERHMTVREAAQAAGVAISTVQNWRSGHMPTNFEAVLKLSDALGVSFSFLLTGVSERPQTDSGSIDARLMRE